MLMFQSLVGFKINWNGGKSRHSAFLRRKMFQSLVGFKINWNNESFFLPASFVILVSIPSRV